MSFRDLVVGNSSAALETVDVLGEALEEKTLLFEEADKMVTVGRRKHTWPKLHVVGDFVVGLRILSEVVEGEQTLRSWEIVLFKLRVESDFWCSEVRNTGAFTGFCVPRTTGQTSTNSDDNLFGFLDSFSDALRVERWENGTIEAGFGFEEISGKRRSCDLVFVSFITKKRFEVEVPVTVRFVTRIVNGDLKRNAITFSFAI
jgi:hypothetical protein